MQRKRSLVTLVREREREREKRGGKNHETRQKPKGEKGGKEAEGGKVMQLCGRGSVAAVNGGGEVFFFLLRRGRAI